ncbi:MAG: phosphocholine cytidylyltransferase family protein [bacterium]
MRKADEMKAVLLAAGRGGRLLPLTADRPKGLLKVGERTLIEYQIEFLRSAGISEIGVVTGHGAAKVRRTCGRRVAYVHNRRYKQTNSLYSLWIAKEFVGGDACLILNSDVLFHPDLLRRLLEARWENCILVDFRKGLGEEEMKVVVENDRIVAISKNLPPSSAQGENLGIVKCGRDGARRVFEIAEQRALQKEWDLWVPHAIQSLIGQQDFYAVASNGLPWIEIDYHHDLNLAEREILPAILKTIKS